MSVEAIVQTEKLTHRYDGRVALRELTLEVRAGEAFALLGPNGSGKTTLFRVLSTLVRPQEGTARVLGMDLASDRERVRGEIGVVFQSPSLDRELTAQGNLMYHGRLYGMGGGSLRERARELLARVDLLERKDERVGALSGGMRRRVEVAKSLLHRPKLLLMDEPSTGLDPVARAELWRYLREMQAREGVTVVLTTHLMDEAERCDRVAIMDEGRLVACDRPAVLKKRVGGDVVTVVCADVAAAQRVLREKLGIEAERVGAAVRFERARGHEIVAAVMEALGGSVEAVQVGRPSLEDVFFQATGHDFESLERPDAAATTGGARRP